MEPIVTEISLITLIIRFPRENISLSLLNVTVSLKYLHTTSACLNPTVDQSQGIFQPGVSPYI